MPRFAANLSMMYAEYAFLDRFTAASRDGFDAVEYLFPYEHSIAELKQRLHDHGLTQVLFNMPAGDWSAGERGLAALPGREEAFRESVEVAMEYALALGCTRLHAMAGVVPAGVHPDRMREVLVDNKRHAARRLASCGLMLLIEPINNRDMPGYFLNFQAQAHALAAEVAESNLKIQMDLYHCQIMEGDLTRGLEQWLPQIGHIQIAGVPERHEPDEGEVNFAHLFRALDRAGYAGNVGCEYTPRAGTSSGLGWLRTARAGAAGH